MNADTGHIIHDINEIDELLKKDYVQLHGDDAKEADIALKGKKEVFIDLHEKTRLANKARNLRKKKKKMNQKSKVNNRRKAKS